MKKEVLEKLSLKFNVPKIVQKPEEGKLYAVRSNDRTEDTEEKTNAGKFETKLFVPGEMVEKECLFVLERASDCFIQEMVIDPDYSFVSIYGQNTKVIVLNNGYCSALTSGKVHGTVYFPDKDKIIGKQEKKETKNGEIVKDNTPNFSKEDMKKIYSMTEEIKEYLGYNGVNIEGTVKNGVIWILQARPFI